MTGSERSIETVADLYQFFRSELGKAFEKLGISTSDATQTYLVHLLESFVRLDKQKIEDLGFQRPAALLFAEALQSAGDRRIETYRRLGDASLFSCGFFQEHLGRSSSLVTVDYYQRLGRTAYSSLQSLMAFKAPGGVFHIIFDELSQKFDPVVQAFRALATAHKAPSTAYLFERWQRGALTGADEWTRLGLWPSSSGGDA